MTKRWFIIDPFVTSSNDIPNRWKLDDEASFELSDLEAERTTPLPKPPPKPKKASAKKAKQLPDLSLHLDSIKSTEELRGVKPSFAKPPVPKMPPRLKTLPRSHDSLRPSLVHFSDDFVAPTVSPHESSTESSPVHTVESAPQKKIQQSRWKQVDNLCLHIIF